MMKRSSTGTLGDVLRHRADASPERLAITFLSYGLEGPPVAEQLSYGQLLLRAQVVAGRLQAECAIGDRVLILCPPGMDYIAAFYGCVLAGMVAVPTYPPRSAQDLGRIEAILADAGATAIVTSVDLSARIAILAGDPARLPPLIQIDAIDAGYVDAFVDPNTEPEALAFLQYTSGTTGIPKGVMVRHAQLLDNVENILELTGLSSSSTVALWLPPYHDMGLIGGLIAGACGNFPTVLMSPLSFIERPLRWLEAISDARATLTMAPNFAYQRWVDQLSDEDVLRLDLSSLVSAMSGAERVRYGTMRAFAAKFAPAGFRHESFHPGYGMAETVLVTSGRKKARSGPKSFAIDPAALSKGAVEVRERVDPERASVTDTETNMIVTTCGMPIKGHTLRIVDPETLRVLPDGRVGEIWVSGPSVAAGYWGNEAATRETFDARIVSDGPDDRLAATPFLRTGDLGTLIDGEVCVLGRMKEMVIVRGHNHYAQDIEATVAASHAGHGHDGIVAFGLDDSGEERVVLVKEHHGDAPGDVDQDRYFATIRGAVLAHHGIAVAAIVLVTPLSLPRTASAKLRRGRTREMFVAGQLASLAQWTSAAPGSTAPEPPVRGSSEGPLRSDETQDLVRGIVAEVMKMPVAELSGQTDFAALGVDSLRAAEIVFGLSERCAKRFPIEIIFDAATIADLAQAIAGQRQDVARPIRSRRALRVSVAKTEEDYRRIVAARSEVFASEYGGQTGKAATVSEWDRRGELLFIEESGAVVAGLLALTHSYPFADGNFYYDRFVTGASMAKIFEEDDVVLEMAQLFSVDRSTATLEALFGGVRELVASNQVIQSRRVSSVRCFYGALTASHALMYREMLSDSWHNFTHIKELKADVYGLDPLFIVADFHAEPVESLLRPQLPRSA